MSDEYLAPLFWGDAVVDARGPVAIYRIRRGAELYETSESRKRKGPLDWVAVSTKHDGKSYRRLIALRGGPEFYAAWIVILQVAAKCPVRWTLADADGPLTACDIAAKTGFKTQIIEDSLEVLCRPEIGWLEKSEAAAICCDLLGTQQAPADSSPTVHDRTVHDRTRQTTVCAEPSQTAAKTSAPEVAVLVFPTAGKEKSWALTERKLAEWTTTFPHLDVHAECRKALQWLLDNPARSKTASGMTRFLGAWLGRAQNSGSGQGRGQKNAARPTGRLATGNLDDVPSVEECADEPGVRIPI